MVAAVVLAINSANMMTFRKHFPVVAWAVRRLTGRWAKGIYLCILLLLLSVTTVARLRTYLMARRIQAVLRGLAEVRIDQTTEEELLKNVPYLIRSQYDLKGVGIVERQYYVEISNESDPWWFWSMAHHLDGSGRLASWFGYRYISFDAGAWVQDGKVSQVSYGLSRIAVRPKAAGYIVSVESAHGFWVERWHPFAVTSQEDESPQYRIAQTVVPTRARNESGLHATFTNDAPPELTKHAFQLELNCFWSLRDCRDVNTIAPALREDSERIKHDTYQQLISGKCPDSIIEGRMRYLPDVMVSLLQVTGSRRVEVNEEGDRAEDLFTDYELKEQIRGKNYWESWKNVRFRETIPSPNDPTDRMANQVWPKTRKGSLVLFFGYPRFDSCRFVPATPSALQIVRNTPMLPKRPEDRGGLGLM